MENNSNNQNNKLTAHVSYIRFLIILGLCKNIFAVSIVEIFEHVACNLIVCSPKEYDRYDWGSLKLCTVRYCTDQTRSLEWKYEQDRTDWY